MTENKPKRLKKVSDYEAQLEALKQREAELKALKKEAEKEEGRKAKNFRTNAGMQLAGVVWRELGLDWDTFDIAKFEKQFAKIVEVGAYKEGNPIFSCEAPKVGIHEARARYTEFANTQRDKAMDNTRKAAQEEVNQMHEQKPWVCPMCGETGTVPTNYYYVKCRKCNHKFDL